MYRGKMKKKCLPAPIHTEVKSVLSIKESYSMRKSPKTFTICWPKKNFQVAKSGFWAEFSQDWGVYVVLKSVFRIQLWWSEVLFPSYRNLCRSYVLRANLKKDMLEFFRAFGLFPEIYPNLRVIYSTWPENFEKYFQCIVILSGAFLPPIKEMVCILVPSTHYNFPMHI